MQHQRLDWPAEDHIRSRGRTLRQRKNIVTKFGRVGHDLVPATCPTLVWSDFVARSSPPDINHLRWPCHRIPQIIFPASAPAVPSPFQQRTRCGLAR